MSATFSPKKFAERYGIAEKKVRRFIETGELNAVNIASRLGGKKPRWRIPAESLAEFEQRRSSTSIVTPKPARRRRSDVAVTPYF